MNLKEENDKLKEVLELARSHIVELCTVMNIPLPDATIDHIDNALSQQDGNDVDTPEQQPIGYARKSDIARLLDETMPDGKHIRIGVDHPSCWLEDSDDQLAPIYAAPQPEQSVPEGYVLLPKQCPSWLEDVYDWSCREHGMLLTLYLPAYDAMVKALEEDQKLSAKG